MDTDDDPEIMVEDKEETHNEIPDSTKVSINLCSECGYLQYTLNEDDDETEVEDENDSEIEIEDENGNEIEVKDEDDDETEVEDENEDEDDEI